jgi:hypothetical protein
MRRALCPAELTVDALDRAATLNTVGVLRVRGPLDVEALARALRRLEQRHPLLRARIERHARGTDFVCGEGAPIPLRVIDGGRDSWREEASAALAYQSWPDEGPRAALTVLQHRDASSSWLLTLHHLIGDGYSCFALLRDLLSFLGPTASVEPLASPGQHAFYPAGHGTWSWKRRALQLAAATARAPEPKRFRERAKDRLARQARIDTFTLDEATNQRLRTRAGPLGHAMLCAAFAKAALEAGQWERAPLRIGHPFDLRRYLRIAAPASDAVGYYASSLDTDQTVHRNDALPEVARAIASALALRARDGGPLLTTPLLAPWLLRPLVRDLKRAAFYERYLMRHTFALSTMGPLERVGLPEQSGALSIDEAFLTGGGSIATSLMVASAEFRGRLCVSLQWIEPLVSEHVARALLSSAERSLRDFADA